MDAFCQLFLEDADFQYWDGVLLKDLKEIKQYYGTKVFKATPTRFRHFSIFQRIKFIEPNIAIGDGTVLIKQDGEPETDKPILNCIQPK